jgi:hypothetical protein
MARQLSSKRGFCISNGGDMGMGKIRMDTGEYMKPDNESFTQLVGPVLGGLSFLAWAGRKVMRTFKTDRLEDLQIKADVGQLERLQKEIDEVNADNKKMSTKLKKLWNAEMDGLPDMAALRVYTDQLAFADCPKVIDGRCPAYKAGGHIAEIAANIHNRREAKKLIFENHEGEL